MTKKARRKPGLFSAYAVPIDSLEVQVLHPAIRTS